MTQVIIDDVIPRTQLTATAGQTVFNTNWTADVASDIDVYARADGVEPDDATQLVSPSLYNVTFIGASQTVRVTFLSGRTLNDIITIVRNTPSTRMNLYINTNFVPSMLNQDFGILTLVDQQAQMYDTVVNPGYNVSAIIDTKDKILPILEANQIWAMNDSNTEIIAYNVPSGGGIAPSDAAYLLQVADSELPNAQAMGALASGLVVNTTTTGVQLTRVLTGTANEITLTNGDGIAGNPIFSITPNPTIPGTEYILLPSGTTAQRPVTPTDGMVRYNTTLQALEVYEGTTWDPLSGGVVDSVVGTANQIDVDNTDSANPVLSLSATLNLPGTFDIQGTTAIDAIINDSTMSTANATNISTAGAMKAYIDALATGLNIQGACVAGSTVALTVTYDNGTAGVGATLTNADTQAAISLDGVSPTVGQRVLIKNQASALQNGIYTVTIVGDGATNWVLTRATDFDTPTEIQPGDLVVLTGGTTQAQSSWLQTDTVTTVGTDSVTFVQFTASLPMGVSSGGTGRTTLTANAILYGDGVNPVGMQSTGTGVLTSLGQNVTGSGGIVLGTSPTITSPIIAQIYGASLVPTFRFTDNASAVNSIIVSNAATGNSPTILATGSDTNVALTLQGTGTSGVRLRGVGTNSNAAAGYVGEIISSTVSSGSAVSLSTGSPSNITSVVLTAGDWDIWSSIAFVTGATTSVTQYRAGICATSATFGLLVGVAETQIINNIPAFVPGVSTSIFPIGTVRVTTTGTTYYLVGQSTFTISTMSAYGSLVARRRT